MQTYISTRSAIVALTLIITASTAACGPAKPGADAPAAATPAADAAPASIAARGMYRATVDSLLSAAVAAGDSAKGDSLVKARSDSERVWLKPAK